MSASYPRSVRHVHDNGGVTLPASPYRAIKAALPDGGHQWAVIAGTGLVQPQVTAWLSDHDALNTQKSYASKVAVLMSWLALHGTDWREVTLTDLTQWVAYLRREVLHRGEPLSEATIGVYIAAALAFYRWAGANGHMPMERVGGFFEVGRLPANLGTELPTYRTVPKAGLKARKTETPLEWLRTREEVDRLLACPMNARDRALFTLLLATGLRIGEALSMFREDLHLTSDSTSLGCDFAGPHLHVKYRRGLENGAAVKDKRGRTLAVAAWWVSGPYEDYREDRFARMGADENPHVFINLYGRHAGAAYSADSFGDVITRLAKQSGVAISGPHVLRHTRATWWLYGVDGDAHDVRTVQALLGHRSLSSTQRYLHVDEEKVRAAAQQVAPLLRGEAEEVV